KKFKPSEPATITFGASNATNLSLYEVDYRYNTTGTWTPLPYNNTLTRSLTITTDKTLKTLELRVRAKNTSNVYSDYVYSEPFEIEHNVAPTVSLTGPGDNSTLYENDTLNIAGTAYDADSDQSVTVYYQINSEQRKVLATNLSKIQIALSKQLTFKGGKLLDGETVLTDTLVEGVAHILKVWAVDNEGAQSTTVERAFYVVPNRAPLLSVDAIVPSGIINTDKFKISGTVSDQDANSNLKVNYRINGANPIEIYDGAGGAWEFEVSLGQLQVGENLIVVEVIDNYNAKTSKTIKLNKDEVKTPILQSVARYKIEPPKGSAKGVLLFVERDEELDLKVELSMTLTGKQEEYVTLSPVNTAPTNNDTVEDTFEYTVPEEKQNIILKITQSRTDLTFNHKIHLISGAVD
ncbi:Ig-like domain-containing protein, partial [Lysinibacillus boronitolerans]|uniref:Ig-like domain-containing protein n=1 Tax=Lysinibacillus boronitolerans TaxID=309788 RepID=UPI00289EBA23